MKTRQRRRLALWGAILFVLTALLLFVYRWNSAPQDSQAWAEESPSLRTGQPLLGQVREPGERSDAKAPKQEKTTSPTDGDPWLKEDPKVRLFGTEIDTVVTEGSFIPITWRSGNVRIDMGIVPTWAADGNLQLECKILRRPSEPDVPHLITVDEGEKASPGGSVPGTLPEQVKYWVAPESSEAQQATDILDAAQMESLLSEGGGELVSMPRVVTKPDRDVTIQSGDTVEGSLVGSRISLKGKRTSDGIALSGNVALRELIDPPKGRPF